MARKFTNNAVGKLNGNITTGATTLTVGSSEGALFPPLAGGDEFTFTLQESGVGIEVVRCTVLTGDVFTTIVRAQEGTSAKAFTTLAAVELRMTAAPLQDKVAWLDQAFSFTTVGPHSIGGVVDTKAQLVITGSFTGASLAQGLKINPTLSPTDNNDAYGLNIVPTLVETSSGTHVNFASVFIQPPTITAGAAALTNASTLKITGAPTGATNNYASWIIGTSRFDGNVGIGLVTPASRLDVEQTLNGDAVIRIKNPGTGTLARAVLSVTGDAVSGTFYAVGSGHSGSGVDAADSVSIGSDTSASGGFNLYAIEGGMKFFTAFTTERMRLTSGGLLLLGTTVTTGAGAADYVTKNTAAYRFLNAAGTSSANYGMSSNSSDNLQFDVPAPGDTYIFGWSGGANHLLFQRNNGGAGIVFADESTADHAAPAANQAVIYTVDNGGKTEIRARFNTGATQLIAAQP